MKINQEKLKRFYEETRPKIKCPNCQELVSVYDDCMQIDEEYEEQCPHCDEYYALYKTIIGFEYEAFKMSQGE